MLYKNQTVTEGNRSLLVETLRWQSYKTFLQLLFEKPFYGRNYLQARPVVTVSHFQTNLIFVDKFRGEVKQILD